MFDDFDTQVQSDEGAEQHEVEQELFQQAAEEDARRQEIREVLEGHLASENPIPTMGRIQRCKGLTRKPSPSRLHG